MRISPHDYERPTLAEGASSAGCKGALHKGRFRVLQLTRTKQCHLRRWVYCRQERVVSFGRGCEESEGGEETPPSAWPRIKLPRSDAFPLKQSVSTTDLREAALPVQMPRVVSRSLIPVR